MCGHGGADTTKQVVQPGNDRSAMVFYPNGSNGEVLLYHVHSRDGLPIQVR